MPKTALPFSPLTALAPLEGVGSPPLLSAMARIGGMGLLCQPFLRIAGQPPRKGFVERLTRRLGPMAQSTQLLGTDPSLIATAAADLERRGVEIIDLNFGCPSKMVTKKGGGAAMLKHPTELRKIVAAVKAAVTIPVFAKVRLGIEDPHEMPDIVRAAEDGGADALTVHARTLSDGYTKPARWEWLARAVELVEIPVIGNGDIWQAHEAALMRNKTGCDAVMLGRGALRNPWIFLQINAIEAGTQPPWPTVPQIASFLEEVAEGLTAETDEPRALSGRIKEVVVHVGRLLDDDGDWRKSVLRSKSLDEVRERIRTLPQMGIKVRKTG